MLIGALEAGVLRRETWQFRFASVFQGIQEASRNVDIGRHSSRSVGGSFGLMVRGETTVKMV